MSEVRPIRVLLVAPNRETSPDPVPPMGTATLAGGLRANGIHVRGIDRNRPGPGHNCDPVLFERIRATGYRGPAWALPRRMPTP